MTKDVSFFYVVGGDEKYYTQLSVSIKSLNKFLNKPKIKILDIGKKLQSKDNVEVIYINNEIKDKKNFWKYKYFITQKIDTEYGCYLDADTVVCSDRIDEAINEIGDEFGVIKHFLLKDFHCFKNYFNNNELAIKYCNEQNISDEDEFFTGGVFFIKIIKET